jgi:hypothetical protein
MMHMALLANVLMFGLATLAWGIYGKRVTEFYASATRLVAKTPASLGLSQQ